MNDTVNIIALFSEGLLSFFSPCILPLIPLYLAYLTSSCKKVDEDGNVSYDRAKVMVTTNFFVLGISMVFVIMALSVSFIKQFISDYSILISIIGGMFLIIMAFNQLGVIRITALEKTRRMDFDTKGEMTALKAFMMGFVFSFAWSPCVGPILAGVLSLAATAEGSLTYVYILFYALGFLIPFLILGIFTEKALNFIRKNQNVVSWTMKIAGVIILLLGLSMIVDGAREINSLQNAGVSEQVSDNPYSYSLVDLDGNIHTLEEHEGNYLFLTFSATWCPHCEDQLPYFKEFVANHDDVDWKIVYSPNSSRVSMGKLEEYLIEHELQDYALIDDFDELAGRYQVSGFPTTFIFTKDNEPFYYIPGQADLEYLESVYDALESEPGSD